MGLCNLRARTMCRRSGASFWKAWVVSAVARALVAPGGAPVRLATSVQVATAPDRDLSELVQALKPSATVEVHGLTMQLRAAGEEVVSLCVGEPDFAPPKEIVDAIGAAAAAGATRYTEVTGTAELRSAIVGDLEGRKGVAYAATEVVVANGAKQAVYEALLALVGPGDEVVVPAPYWVSYPSMVEMAGATVRSVPCGIDDGYKLTGAALRSALTRETKAVILCNPSNPTGAVVDERSQRDLLRVLEAHEEETGTKVWVISDEIYERLYYGSDGGHVAFASLSAGAFARTVTINGFSKAFAMTGFRLGYLAAPQAVAKACGKIQGQITSCASSLAQAAGVAALKLPLDALDGDVETFRRRRDLVLDALATIAKKKGRITCPPPPEGAFYVFFGVAGALGLACDGETVDSSTTFCTALLGKRKLALVPGDAFGAPDGVRLSYAASEADLATALAAIDAFVNDDCA